MRTFQHLPNPDDFEHFFDRIDQSGTIATQLETELGKLSDVFVDRELHTRTDHPRTLPCWDTVERSVKTLYPDQAIIPWKASLNLINNDEEYLVIPVSLPDTRYVLRSDIAGVKHGVASNFIPSHMIWMAPYETVRGPIALVHLEPAIEERAAEQRYMLSDGAWREVICNLTAVCSAIKEGGDDASRNRVACPSLVLSLALEDSARRLPPDNVISGIRSLEYKRHVLSMDLEVSDFDTSKGSTLSPSGIIVPKTFTGAAIYTLKGKDRCSFTHRVGRDKFGFPELEFLSLN